MRLTWIAVGLASMLVACSATVDGGAAPAESGPVASSTSAVSPTPTPTTAPTRAATPLPTPTPPDFTAADVVVTAGDLTLEYAVDRCPVIAWTGDALGPGVTFGIYPNGTPASDGRQWATQMVVLRMTNGTPADWSFILSTPPGVTSAENDRRLMSGPNLRDMEMAAEVTDGRAVFMTRFLDPAASALLAGTVTVTCR